MVEAENLEGFKDWPQAQTSNHKSTQPQKTQLRKTLSMVVIRDSINNNNDFSIFPPLNHENIYISSDHNQNQQNPISPSSSFSLSDANGSDPASPRPPSPASDYLIRIANGWWRIGFEVLRAKICRIASSFCFNSDIKQVICSLGPAARLAAVMMAWWLFTRFLRRRRENAKQLKTIIREKDEKIKQLLHQIAQMNELLIANRAIDFKTG